MGSRRESRLSVYARLASFENVWAAYLDARRGKRRRPDVARFALVQEAAVLDLSEALATETWRPSGFRAIVLRDPKPRLIAVAPFADGVVNHAVHRVVAPLLERRFTADTFACLPGRGTHRAVLRFQDGLRRNAHVAQMDVRRYYLEIDWDLLLEVVGRSVHDERLHRLLQRILAAGSGIYSSSRVLEALGLSGTYHPAPRKGLPIGSLMSQLFGNVYLDGLDHFVKRELKVPAYVRYLDDFALFGPSRSAVREWAAACTEWLEARRRLEVKPPKVGSARQSYRFLGHVVSRGERRTCARTRRRLAARVAATARGRCGPAEMDALRSSVASSIGAVRT